MVSYAMAYTTLMATAALAAHIGERDVAIVALDPDKGPPLAPGEYRVEVRLDVGLPALIVGETTLKVPG